MPIRREWLDWSKPCLPAAADWLIEHHQMGPAPDSLFADAGDSTCDLSSVVCVLPGRRAGRLLLAQLIERCASKGIVLIPPVVLTPNPMVDRLLQIDSPTATQTEMVLAWLSALRALPTETLGPLLPSPPQPDELPDWRELAITIARLYEELSGQRLTFGDVAARADRLAMVAEGDRWRVLEQVRELYERSLTRAGLTDPHRARESALRATVNQPRKSASPQKLVLIGITELNAVQRAAVERAADRAIALTHAPRRLADRFDSVGCVRPESWRDIQIELRDDQIKVADRPDDQAQEALRAVAEFGGRFSAAEITIGLGDETLAPVVERAADWAGLPVRSAIGNPLGQSPPARALMAIADWLDDDRFANFAAMLRHPDLEDWVRREASDQGVAEWLTLLDRYFEDHLHERFSGEWLGDKDRAQKLAGAYDAVTRLLAPLNPRGNRNQKRPLGEWSQPLLDILAKLYGDSPVSSGDPAAPRRAEACMALRDVLAEFAAAPMNLQPNASAAQAVRLMLLQAAQEQLPHDPLDNQIEMLGWLELHLDLAPALVITGFNDEHIPHSISADLFLPDSMRAQLGLSCNSTRYARDAYLMQAIGNSRPHVTVVAGRRTAQGEPLTPSRLLLACEPETLVRRIRSLCVEPTELARPAPIGLPPPAERSKFSVPLLPVPIAAPQYMTITEFRSYLTCPYRYALERRLGLEAFDGDARELDPLQFGTLAHEILCTFGSDDDIRCSTSPDGIEKYLFNALDAASRLRFGASPITAVRVQLARMKQRIRSFAQRQAQLCDEGWRIRHCELHFDGSIALDMPDQPPMPLHARIDRIDQHEHTGAWRIIDYKTGDGAESPHKTHHGRETFPPDDALEWIDLQLPLYHYLATRSEHKIVGEIELAYFCLPKQANGAALKPGQWTARHIENAIDRARQVVRSIRACEFQINTEFDKPFDAFARICQTQVYAEPDLEEVET
ncbi:MAG: PD-(D/E)XK nuclease family protein [Phycisphaerales bacterium]|nr:PD-(D/E)XK nuclease family protein [Phycisphaerales bacterium]MCI0675533.1 PD-(D/E)XK nuclease family protein [Phycisphaerales bacterium]